MISKNIMFVIAFFVSLSLLIVVLLVGFFYSSPQEPLLSPSVVVIEDNIIEDGVDLLSYENIRFLSREITYSFNPDCSNSKFSEVNEAFSILGNETNLSFQRVNLDGDININCFEDIVRTSDTHHLVGTGAPISIINTSRYYIISKGSINLYGVEKCGRPVYAMHEILHVLGFTHSLNKGSVMYEILSCDQIITREITEKIEDLYDDPILPDLEILKIEIVKSANFLEVHAVVLNTGLKNIESTSVTLYNNDREVMNFKIGGFDVGIAKVVTLDEIRLSRLETEFIIAVDDRELIEEIDEFNNAFAFNA